MLDIAYAFCYTDSSVDFYHHKEVFCYARFGYAS